MLAVTRPRAGLRRKDDRLRSQAAGDGRVEPLLDLVLAPNALSTRASGVRVLRTTVAPAVPPLAFVGAPVRPDVATVAVLQVVDVLPLVDHAPAIWQMPLHSPVAVQLAVAKVALVHAAVLPDLLPVALPLVVAPIPDIRLRLGSPRSDAVSPPIADLSSVRGSILVHLLGLVNGGRRRVSQQLLARLRRHRQQWLRVAVAFASHGRRLRIRHGPPPGDVPTIIGRPRRLHRRPLATRLGGGQRQARCGRNDRPSTVDGHASA
mmetsp:Transcript_75976/g.220657  ORF Transcript_75976/g.220657 Transcript_75976/m.220657 type:complete len:263 (+) Transcript_75976:97-885(+)